MIERATQWCHIVSAFWVVVLALIIFIDVCGRALFNSPLLGAAEIIKNSVVAIAFLQLPLAILRGGMLRSTLLVDTLNPTAQRWCRSLGNVLGLMFFLAVAVSSWTPFTEALLIGEYEGEGALRVPTYPVRLLLVLTTAFAAIVYLKLLLLDWQRSRPPKFDDGADS